MIRQWQNGHPLVNFYGFLIVLVLVVGNIIIINVLPETDRLLWLKFFVTEGIALILAMYASTTIILCVIVVEIAGLINVWLSNRSGKGISEIADERIDARVPEMIDSMIDSRVPEMVGNEIQKNTLTTEEVDEMLKKIGFP